MAFSEIVTTLDWPQMLSFCVLVCIICYFGEFLSRPRYPDEIPQVGYGNGPFGVLRNYFTVFTRHQTWINEGYSKYGKNGLPFIVPVTFTHPYQVVIPQSQVRWMSSQPDRILSPHEAHRRSLYYEYIFLDPALAKQTFSSRVLHKFAPRLSPSMIPSLQEDIDFAMTKSLSQVTEEWTCVNVWSLAMEVVSITTAGLLAGSALSRNECFSKGILDFSNAAARAQLLLRMLPRALHPVAGYLVTIPNRKYWKKMCRAVMPTIEECVRKMTLQAQGSPEYKDYVPSEDYITWVIRFAISENKTAELKPTTISKRLLPVSFASIHTSVSAFHAWICELASASADQNLLNILRDEIVQHKPSSGTWTKTALQSLVKVDSSIRESQRINFPMSTLIEREVVAPEGLHHPDFGWTLPKGSILTTHTQGIQTDNDTFDDPLAYKPLRFFDLREEKASEATRSSAYDMVTPSDEHFSFGHGRHACPGRFLVSYKLKMILAHLLTHYDIKMAGPKPERRWIASTVIPALSATIQVRRRKEA